MPFFSKIMPAIALLLLLCSGSITYAVDKALIIGVERYKNPRANLKGIQLDVDMAKEMALRLGIKKQHMQVLQDDQATRRHILNALKKLAHTTKPTDKVFIYYSGHGAQVKDTDGDEPDGKDETWYVHDGHILDDDINTVLGNIKSTNMVVLIDACHSGTSTKSIAPNALSAYSAMAKTKSAGYFNIKDTDIMMKKKWLAKASQKAQHYVAIAAAQDHQESLATRAGSLFTRALFESLEKARTEKTKTTWQSIYSNTKNRLDALPLPPHRRFSPHLDGNQQLANKRIMLANPAHHTSTGSRVNWNHMLATLNKLDNKVKILAPTQLHVGDTFKFTVIPPQAGYLNVVTVGADDAVTVLFPNQYNTNNRVSKEALSLPGRGKFEIQAVKPSGKSMVVAFLSQKKINLHQRGFGHLDNTGHVNKAFARISRAALSASLPSRNLAVKPAESNTLAAVNAGYVIVDIHE